ncbi:BLUF domain-containing protein [Winogradskyella schleiferi]|uniref:BLUF domain-containing protein n=1 Tax=Winogradskyella schleiferi TaxID=2686078 RepID=UPI0015B9ABB7|nr:BLUF domain-containing protein [Winogradskyella schleiferi]
MYQLTYRSKAISTLEIEDLDNILVRANEVNKINDITGCLIFLNGAFVQILEGGQKEVNTVFEKIKLDSRHHSVELLWENQYDKRHFSDWNMTYYRPNESAHTEYVNNLLLLSQFSEKFSGTLLRFWTSVGKLLNDDPNKTPEYIF